MGPLLGCSWPFWLNIRNEPGCGSDLLDLSNTYFEGCYTLSDLLAHGRNKEKRTDIFIHWSHLPSAGEGFMPTLEKCLNRYKKTPPIWNTTAALKNRSNIVLGRAWSPSLHRPALTSSLYYWDKIPPLIINYLQGNVGHGAAYPMQGGFMPTLVAAGHLLCILSAVGRVGINPTPTWRSAARGLL